MSKAPIEIRSLARKHTEEALDRLVFWMRSDNAKASVASSAALLDRGWGKATQPISGEEDGPPIKFTRIELIGVSPSAKDS
jgi:hypothetical protein